MGRTKGSKNGKYGSNIDKQQFERLCSLMCTEQEICGFFATSHDTLNRWCHQEYDMTFTEIWEQKSSLGKISLRRNQFKIAENNASMAIFLGKKYLGQRDNIEVEHNAQNGILGDLIGALNKAKENK